MKVEKVVRIGTMADHPSASVFCKIEFADKRLSISGVEGPKRNGDAWGACGQIDMHLTAQDIAEFAPGWSADLLGNFLLAWKLWHLNDMRAGCEHQRTEWYTEKEVTLTHYKWSKRFHDWRRSAENGSMSAESYAVFQEVVPRVHAVTIGFNTPKYESPEVACLLADDWITVEKEEVKRAGWVHVKEHPDGLLCRPCPTCGYEYGSKWLMEEIPQSVIDFLAALPDADREPAWV